MTSRGEELLSEAESLYAELRNNPTSFDISRIGALRQKARSALDWLEDTPDFEKAHVLLDHVGELIRRVRPDACVLEFEDGTYYRTCPVDLAHSRVGLSPAFIIRAAECSVCGMDPWDCEHIAGETYEGQVAHVVITDAQLIEVSVVSRPQQPDARIVRMSIDHEDLPSDSETSWGDEIVCGRCLLACGGVSDSFDSDVSNLKGPGRQRPIGKVTGVGGPPIKFVP